MRDKAQPPLPRRERRTNERRDRLHERPNPGRRARRRPIWQSPIAVVSSAALIVALGVILLSQKPTPSPLATLVTPPLTYAADMVNGATLGKGDAPVVMDLFVDFQCPVCGRFIQEQFGTLKTRFIDPGVLRVDAHDIDILGQGTPNESLDLATGARCAADQGRYWTFHDYVFWNQQAENRGAYTSEFIASIATASGVDMTTWDTCFAGTTARMAVQRATSAALAAGINGTPTIALNGGAPVAGLPDAATLVRQIEALAAAASPAATTKP